MKVAEKAAVARVATREAASTEVETAVEERATVARVATREAVEEKGAAARVAAAMAVASSGRACRRFPCTWPCCCHMRRS